MEPTLVFAFVLRRYAVGRVVVQHHPYLFVGVLAQQLVDKPAYMLRPYVFPRRVCGVVGLECFENLCVAYDVDSLVVAVCLCMEGRPFGAHP